MDHWNRSSKAWGIEEFFGATVVICIFISIALSFWPGWRAVHVWLSIPPSQMATSPDEAG